MLKNYIKIAFRNLLKNKVYSFINIFGLAIGMAVTIMIGLWVSDELNYNNYYKNKSKIAQVYQSQGFNGKVNTDPAVPRPLEFKIRENYKDNFTNIVMASWTNSRYLHYGDKTITRDGSYMQAGISDLLDLEIIEGDKNGIKEKHGIMLSQSTAKALFGGEKPLGKTIKLNSSYNMVVTAIYKDIPVNNTFHNLDCIMPWEHYVTSREWAQNSKDDWGNNSFQMFVKINDNTTMDVVSSKIKNVKKDNASEDIKLYNPQLFLLPMEDWYLRSKFEGSIQTGGRIENVWLFGIIGVFVLLLACINFVNLTTARSEKRATEVGIRKSIGSKRGQLIFQFLSESFLVIVFAFIVAISIVLIFLNGFNTLAHKAIVFPWLNIQFWIISILFILFTTVLSGSYPALYLSSFKPVSVLKGTFKAGRFAALPRKILVVTQFTVSITLIIGTLIVMSQIEYSKNRPIGYDKEGLIQLPTMSSDFIGKADVMRHQFIASGAVIEMATSSSPATAVWSNRSGYMWDGKPEGFQEDLAYTTVSYEFINTLNAELVAGRGFSREFATDSNAVILNETAVKYMGLKNPIGMYLRDDSPENPEAPLKIIGVIKDIIVQSPYDDVKQAMYVFDKYGKTSYYNLRLNPKQSVSSSLASIEKIFKANFPNLPFEYQFIDQEYADKFMSEERIANLAKIFTILAIFISCLGLFGLASFVAEQRTKEIGIRKILGASVSHLWTLLSKDFIVLVIISLMVASPIAYYIMYQWLQKFIYRINISWNVFLIAGSGALAITIITISLQAIRTLSANPVNSLRTE